MNYESGQVAGEEQVLLPDYGAPAPRRRRRIIAAVGALVAILAAVFVIFGGKKDAPKAEANAGKAPAVTVVVPGRQMVDRSLTANGSLAAKRDMPVGVAGEGGMVRRVLVEPGQWVRQGQVLAEVDRSVQTQTAASLAAQVGVTRADLDIAQSELDRAKQLVDRGFISKADLQRKTATRDAAAARVKVAQASLAETRARNGRLDIRAPTAGLVLARAVEAGQIVSPASGALFRMAMGGELEMRAQFAESDLQGITTGVRAEVTPVGSARAYEGRVWQVSPVVDPQTRQGLVRIQLAYDQALRPGGFAEATVHSGTTTAPLLPQSAIQTDDKGTYVYVVDASDQAVRRDVKLGQVSDKGVVISEGLSGTERVVLSAGAFLNPGQKVSPTRAALPR